MSYEDTMGAAKPAMQQAVTGRTRVQTYSVNYSTNQQSWKLPFNSVCFTNYDTAAPVYINTDIVIPPAILAGGFVYPTFLEISLNVNEVNDKNFIIDFRAAAGTTAKLVIIWTEYDKAL